jgi:hypothetical protein
MSKPLTTGTTWLKLSLAAFNGTKYADKSSPTDFIKSYRAYKFKKNKWEAVQLIDDNPQFSVSVAEELTGKQSMFTQLPVSSKTYCPHCGAAVRLTAE